MTRKRWAILSSTSIGEYAKYCKERILHPESLPKKWKTSWRIGIPPLAPSQGQGQGQSLDPALVSDLVKNLVPNQEAKNRRSGRTLRKRKGYRSKRHKTTL